MNYTELSYVDVALAASLIAVNAAISIAMRLGLEQRMIVAAVRMVVQLSLVGLVLKALFAAASPWFTALAMVVMVAFAGGSIMAYDVTMGTMLQLTSRDEMRGRVLGIYGLTFGFTPVGGFFAGSVAAVLSASIAVATGGIIIIVYVASIARSILRISPRA